MIYPEDNAIQCLNIRGQMKGGNFFPEGIQFNNSELQTTQVETEMNVSSHLIEKQYKVIYQWCNGSNGDDDDENNNNDVYLNVLKT